MKKTIKNMKYPILFFLFFFAVNSTTAQFKPTEKGLTIIVSDGTYKGKNSKVTTERGDIPTSYDQIAGKGKGKSKSGVTKNSIAFTDPIRELGMTDCIQAAAFLERPQFGKLGFMLIFSINDAIGGKQATLEKDGKTYKGVYRLIRQKTSSKEKVPKGMATYKISGTFIILGMS